MSLNCRPELCEKREEMTDNIKSFGNVLTSLLDACEGRYKYPTERFIAQKSKDKS